MPKYHTKSIKSEFLRLGSWDWFADPQVLLVCSHVWEPQLSMLWPQPTSSTVLSTLHPHQPPCNPSLCYPCCYCCQDLCRAGFCSCEGSIQTLPFQGSSLLSPWIRTLLFFHSLSQGFSNLSVPQKKGKLKQITGSTSNVPNSVGQGWGLRICISSHVMLIVCGVHTLRTMALFHYPVLSLLWHLLWFKILFDYLHIYICLPSPPNIIKCKLHEYRGLSCPTQYSQV